MKYLVLAVMLIYIASVGFLLGYGKWQQFQSELSLSGEDRVLDPSVNNEIAREGVPSLTSSEVAKHNKADDCWIIINNNVYDVGKYLDLHPGGADVIVPFCGKDATTAFNTQGGRGRHSPVAQKELGKYLIGPLR